MVVEKTNPHKKNLRKNQNIELINKLETLHSTNVKNTKHCNYLPLSFKKMCNIVFLESNYL